MNAWIRLGEFLQFLTMTAKLVEQLVHIFLLNTLSCTVMAYLCCGWIPGGCNDLLGSLRRSEQLSDHLQSEAPAGPRDQHRATLCEIHLHIQNVASTRHTHSLLKGFTI